MIIPLGHRVLVRQLLKDNSVIISSVEQREDKGVVEEVGEAVGLPLVKGDIVYFGELAGLRVPNNDSVTILINEDEILAKEVC